MSLWYAGELLFQVFLVLAILASGVVIAGTVVVFVTIFVNIYRTHRQTWRRWRNRL